MSSIFESLKSFMPWTTSSQPSSQPSDPSSDPYSELSFSMIEIDGNLYYLSSMHIDQCILKFSHTMNLDLLDTFVKYATGLSNEKTTTIVFKKTELTNGNGNEEKKVVGFWHPQLSRFIVRGTESPTGDSVPRKPPQGTPSPVNPLAYGTEGLREGLRH